MASSNRHWPSMFKSKPHQWQHEVHSSSTLLPSGCHRSQYSSGCEERTPEPKPRWNPKPEQIRILEAIFDSGMVNPPRDEIRKIRAQLQEYGQVGDANVFYWFQNRKSRSKHKLRHLQGPNKHHNRQMTSAAMSAPATSSPATTAAATSSSSSSDNKPSPKDTPNKSFASTIFSLGPSTTNNVSNNNSPSSFSLSQTVPYFPSHEDVLAEPFPAFHTSHGFLFSEPQVAFNGQPVVGNCGSGFLLSEIMAHGGGASKKVKMNPNPPTITTTSTDLRTISPSTDSAGITIPFLSSLSQGHGGGSEVAEEPAVAGAALVMGGVGGVAKSTVFINDVAFEVAAEPFNVRAAFGDDAVLINSSGQPVVTDEWGLTLQPLQHGAFYYMI